MDLLKYIFQKPMPIVNLAKRQLLLSEFDIIYVTQKAVKGQALVDHLVENPIDGEYEPLKMHFPNEEVSFVLGELAAKNTNIFPHLELIKRFTKIEFKHVPRIQNEFTVALATLSSMIQHPDKNFIDPIPIGIHKQPTYYAHVEEKFDENPWLHDIME
ncbi:uncharacterized protein [Nicotiana sylvestris]|uniref:uncharacterized protein n=1 Tax=Nicotiana sylvestris TaxID=4096 RepID=UPI00388CEB43